MPAEGEYEGHHGGAAMEEDQGLEEGRNPHWKLSRERGDPSRKNTLNN